MLDIIVFIGAIVLSIVLAGLVVVAVAGLL